MHGSLCSPTAFRALQENLLSFTCDPVTKRIEVSPMEEMLKNVGYVLLAFEETGDAGECRVERISFPAVVVTCRSVDFHAAWPYV